MERVRIAVDTVAARKQETVAAMLQLQDAVGGREPSRPGHRQGRGIVKTLQRAQIREVDTIGSRRQPEERDVVVSDCPKSVGGVVVRPSGVLGALVHRREGSGQVAIESLLLIDNLERVGAGDYSEDPIRILEADRMHRGGSAAPVFSSVGPSSKDGAPFNGSEAVGVST